MSIQEINNKILQKYISTSLSDTISENGFSNNSSSILPNKVPDVLKKFYDEHNNCEESIKKISKKGDLLIGTYNVHQWENINKNIDVYKNFNNIINYIRKLNCDIIILQEISTRHIHKNNIYDKFKSIGYSNNFMVPNGESVKRDKTYSYIGIFAKEPFDKIQEINLTVYKYYRRCIMCIYKGCKIVAVHLEIGDRYHLPNISETEKTNIIKANTDKRLSQLQKILDNFSDIDIICGDFNFSYENEESKWLRKYMNFGLVQDLKKTTPYNRTDMFFINKKSSVRPLQSFTLDCNLSDHLPVVLDIKKL